ncbi:sugar transferase [Flavobacteriaceae bacterium F89]|uniref:Sugar transferase n=1 Tax=Cerina litoralis TaxID=2874477 RepID=A0AAE3EWW3_9FLAO|nr:sugar transferase [Cerina litoralis]MCG2461197.1 sugar transferase [Cerina litoralis]
MYKHVLKPLIDFITSLILLILISPVFVVIMIALSFSNRGNPFFRQQRPGKNEVLFYILKFKTMNDIRDDNGLLLDDSERLTKLGRVIRKTSMDELPQLLNVLMGQMSFIGPRPLLIKYLPHYTERERIRHTVRPGITGLAQVSGRNLLNWNDRLELDVEYVENLSFLLDVKIFLKTVMKVITAKDIVVDPQSIMPSLESERSNQK